MESTKEKEILLITIQPENLALRVHSRINLNILAKEK